MIVESAIYRPNSIGLAAVAPNDLAEILKFDRFGPDSFAVVTLDNPNPDELGKFANAFDIHPLALADASNSGERPKIDMIGGTLTISMKAATYDEATESVSFVHTTALVGARFALIVRLHEPDDKSLVPTLWVDDHASASHRSVPDSNSPGSYVMAHLERAVASFVPVVDEIERDVTQIEEDVFAAGSGANSKRIYLLLRQVLAVQRAAVPLQDVCQRIESHRRLDLPPQMEPQIADMLDTTRDVVDRLSTERALLDSALDANLTQIGIRQNEDMRKISAWAAVLAVPTMIAGIYGMNFKFMPELEKRWGYPLILGIMVVACLVLYRTFKKNGWL